MLVGESGETERREEISLRLGSRTVGLTAGLTFAVNNYLVDEKDMKSYTKHVASFLAGSLLYPLQVTSTCMTVSRSGLMAGYPPNMPLYTSWTNCFSHLRAQGQLKRGSSLLFRYYSGPQVGQFLPLTPIR